MKLNAICWLAIAVGVALGMSTWAVIAIFSIVGGPK